MKSYKSWKLNEDVPQTNISNQNWVSLLQNLSNSNPLAFKQIAFLISRNLDRVRGLEPEDILKLKASLLGRPSEDLHKYNL